jgi:heat-inducible transcriptional repressor
VLHSIVQAYLENGEPVASKTVARGLSPASVRLVMADLGKEGYLAQPHTSAGRVPTLKAIQLYTQSLVARTPLAPEVRHLRSRLETASSIGDRVALMSHLLSEMTARLGIAAAIPTESQTLEQIELVALPERRVLMIVATSDRLVRNRVVTVESAFSSDDLAEIRNYVNWSFKGWPLGRIRAELRARLEEDRAAYDGVLRRLQLLYSKGLLDIGTEAELSLEGTGNLLADQAVLEGTLLEAQEEFPAGEEMRRAQSQIRELLRALEHKRAVLEMLERFLEAEPGTVSVQVGLGEAHPSMNGLSLIGLNVSMPGGMRTKVAVLGPARMNYARAMAVVLQMGEALAGRT